MEDEHNVQGDELASGHGEGKTNEDGVEDDTELEDEDGSKLGGVVGRHEVTGLKL